MADYTNQILQALQKSIQPDTELIKQATVELQTLYKDPRCIPTLFDVAINSDNAAVTQLALTELRKRVSHKKSVQWNKQAEDVKVVIKSRLLEGLQGMSKVLRNSSIKLIDAIASADFKKGQWPELQQYIVTTTSAPDAVVREIGFQLLRNILYVFFDTFTKANRDQADGNIAQVAQLLRNGVSDPAFEVRMWAIRGIADVAEFVTTKHTQTLAVVQDAFPHVVQCLAPALESGDESNVKVVTDSIQEVVVSHAGIINNFLPSFVEFMLQQAGNGSFAEDQRSMVLNCFFWIVKWKKNKISSLNLMPQIAAALVNIAAVEEDTDDDDELALARTCMTLIDQFSRVFPPKQIFPALFERIQQLFPSSDPLQRKSAICALGAVTEGCSLFMIPYLNDIWPIVGSGLGDSDLGVCQGALLTLSYMCEYFEEEVSKHHAILLPSVFRLITAPQTQKRACYALDCLLEILGADIVPYLNDLMTSLLGLLDTAPVSIKGSVVGAIGSAAHASKSKVTPFLEPALARIVPFLQLTEDTDNLRLRGISQDTCGTLAEAVGCDAYRPYFQPVMAAALQALEIKDAPNLKECSYVYFSVMARLYKAEFEPYVPTVVPLLMEAAGQDEFKLDEGELGEESTAAAFNPAAGDDDDSNYSDLDDEIGSDEDDEIMKAVTAIAYEKEMAIDALAEVIANLPSQTVPEMSRIMEIYKDGLQNSWSDGVRKSSVSAVFRLVSIFYTLNGRPAWTAGASPAPLPTETQALLDSFIPDLLPLFEDEDMGVVTTLCTDLGSTLDEVGPAVVLPAHLQDVCAGIEQILKGAAACQRDVDEASDNEEEGSATNNAAINTSEYDALLIDEAANLVAKLAAAIGPAFAPLFERFLPDMLRFCEPERQAMEKSAVLGAFADITKNLGAAVTDFTGALYPVLITSLRDESSDVRTNAAYALGMLVLHSTADMSGEYMAVLQALSPLFSPTDPNNKSEQTTRDNACGCVSRMLIKNNAAVPLDQVLPVLVASLPLRVDFAESAPVFDALFALFAAQVPAVFTHIDALLPVFKTVLDSTAGDAFHPDSETAQLTVETRGRLVELLNHLNASVPQQISAAGLSGYLA